MTSRRRLFALATLCLTTVRALGAVADHSGPVRPDEMADATAWVDGRTAAFAATPPAPAEPSVHCVGQGWGKFQSGLSVNRNPLTLLGKIYRTGFGSHAPAVIEIAPAPGQSRLTGVCGVDDTPEARQTKHAVVFTIDADGREVFHSRPLTAVDAPAAFDLDLKGVRQLTFKTVAPDKDYTYTPIDYCDLRFTSADGTTQLIGRPVTDERGHGGCFGFTLDGHASSVPAGWTLRREPLPARPDRTAERFTWSDPVTGMETSLDLTRYTHYPVVEWVQRFRNNGKADAPVLDAVHAMDLLFAAPDKVILHHNTGDYESDDGYAPHVTDVLEGKPLHFAPTDGRPSDRVWPYFNVEEPVQHRGEILAVGWPGQWAADFSRVDDDGGGRLHVTAGQETLRVRLHPGEEIRTPLSVVLFYRGDWVRSQNLWRRWMIDCNTPRPHGELPPNVFSSALGLWQSAKSEIDGIKLFAGQHVPLTHWWMDAGWYPCPKDQWWYVGTWEPDPQRFPDGIKAVSDVAHANHMGLILWIEPERSRNGSWLDTHHPEFLLTAKGEPDNKLFDLGNPDAWKWMVDHVDHLLVSQGVDLYRQDFNIAPLQFWQQHDTPDRQGMTEMRHVEGHLAFWDELHRRHPDLLIDTCASGGRRLDLETLRRSVPLWRSDDSENPETNQSITYGLAEWLPYYGSGVGCDSAYIVRSQMHPFLALGLPHTPGLAMDWDLYHREMNTWLAINQDLSGDYYPLLPYRIDRDSWMAWQFDRPDLGRGVVQAFRRPDSAYAAANFKLHGLDPAATYQVTDRDHLETPRMMTGRALAEAGLDVRMDTAPAAAIVTYEKQP